VNRFCKAQRLLKKSDYDILFKQAKRLVTPEFIILHHKNTLGYARLGLALSKKVIAKAHNRNRIKRLLREAFRTARLPAIDMIFLARNNVGNVENKTLFAKLSAIWDKLTALYVT
jgi:ribonuclease P protein component